MVDDQDRCEWVNVSSGSGSSANGRKTVVAVAVPAVLVAVDCIAPVAYIIVVGTLYIYG